MHCSNSTISTTFEAILPIFVDDYSKDCTSLENFTVIKCFDNEDDLVKFWWCNTIYQDDLKCLSDEVVLNCIPFLKF